MINFPSFLLVSTNMLPRMLGDCCTCLCARIRASRRHGSHRMTASAMIDRCKKLHQAENLSSCSYSAFYTSTHSTSHNQPKGDTLPPGRCSRRPVETLLWCKPRQSKRPLSIHFVQSRNCDNLLSSLFIIMPPCCPELKETFSVWRLQRPLLRSWPPWSVGACLLANLPSKSTLTTIQQHLSSCCDQNG
jgi:hypothetical protein